MVPLQQRVGHCDFSYIFLSLSSAFWLYLSWVDCDSLLFSPLFVAGFPLLHTSFRFDSASKLSRLTQLSGVQDRMRPVSSEVRIRVGMGGSLMVILFLDH